MIKKIACVAMAALMLAAVVGCEKSNHASPTDLSGSWTFNVRSTDDQVTFQNTSLVIAAITNSPGQYDLLWASPVPNGTATFDTNTLTVAMDIMQSPAVLQLSGTLTSDTTMSGSGTIMGYGGLREVTWDASR